MDNALLITILILIAVAVLFILAASSDKRAKKDKTKKLLETLIALKAGSESEDLARRRDTIIKLDNILSKVLQYKLNNENMCGDNLKLAKKYFKRDLYQSLWDVHKLRNDVVHDDEDISLEESKDAYRVYNMSINKLLK